MPLQPEDRVGVIQGKFHKEEHCGVIVHSSDLDAEVREAIEKNGQMQDVLYRLIKHIFKNKIQHHGTQEQAEEFVDIEMEAWELVGFDPKAEAAGITVPLPEMSKAEAIAEASKRANGRFFKVDNDGGWMIVAWTTDEGLMFARCGTYRECFEKAFLVPSPKDTKTK